MTPSFIQDANSRTAVAASVFVAWFRSRKVVALDAHRSDRVGLQGGENVSVHRHNDRMDDFRIHSRFCNQGMRFLKSLKHRVRNHRKGDVFSSGGGGRGSQHDVGVHTIAFPRRIACDGTCQTRPKAHEEESSFGPTLSLVPKRFRFLWIRRPTEFSIPCLSRFGQLGIHRSGQTGHTSIPAARSRSRSLAIERAASTSPPPWPRVVDADSHCHPEWRTRAIGSPVAKAPPPHPSWTRSPAHLHT